MEEEKMGIVSDDYDSPWKEAIETFLPDFVAFFFPRADAEIDWTRGYVFLDQELRQVQREAELGRQVVDKLVQVYRTDGSDAFVLIHIEVQSQPDPDFAQRMFTYYYRRFDRFDRQIASVAILGDESPSWHPHSFSREFWGSGVQFAFHTVKLLDYRADRTRLDNDPNPFAAIIQAHLETQTTRHNPNARLQAKLAVLRRLYARGYNREQILGLYRFIDWIMALPVEYERRFLATVEQIEEGNQMPYVTSAERFGREEGLKEGLKEGLMEGIEVALFLKFGEAGREIVPEIRQLTDVGVIRRVHGAIVEARTIDDVRRVYA